MYLFLQISEYQYVTRLPLCVSVYMCLVVSCWERVELLALVCGVLLCVCHFSIGILGQVLYLIVSIPELCTLTNSELSKLQGLNKYLEKYENMHLHC